MHLTANLYHDNTHYDSFKSINCIRSFPYIMHIQYPSVMLLCIYSWKHDICIKYNLSLKIIGLILVVFVLKVVGFQTVNKAV